MKKIILPLTIFVIMLIGIYYSTNYTISSCEYLIDLATETEEYIAFNQWDNAYINSLKLLDDFEKSIQFISLFSDHEHLDNLYIETLKATQFINEKDKSHSLSTIHAIKGLIEAMKDEEKITLKNIF
ncbi:DUF4363 family protein [Clostridium senegalense]|uniref:DUF4363 family protein n=1 Tax=Clostridium senegalense TaxID=1465809 RepID=UPI001C103DEF|nr:DUF4363 family protein [Clostridium senegalense]MBU5226205.1 DUF4363 family protein [Clostridium senegalense]